MNFSLDISFSSSLLLFLLLLITFIVYEKKGKKRTVPEAAGAWPIIGHLHLLAGSQPPHITLGNMADKFGPLFSIKLGVHRTLVVSSWDIAKEFFTTHDKVFSSRPKTMPGELLGYNYAMFGFSPYGPYWRELRKIATLEVLSNARLETLKHVRLSEVKTAIKEINDLWVKSKESSGKVCVEMQKWFRDLNMNIIFRTVVGKRYVEAVKSNDRLREEMRIFFVLSGLFPVGDALPFLRWFDIGGHEKAMKKNARGMDIFVQQWLEEHRQKRLSGENKQEQDFMDAMISVVDNAEELPSYDADTIIKATSLALILGGTDTTTTSLTWTLSLLLNKPEALEKAQHELETIIGKERQVLESDLKNLPYLQAIVKEALRLYPSGPLSVPREALEDSVVVGYHIPVGTRLLVNLSKIHRDPRVWSDPCEFRPERFLTTHKDIDVRGQNYELLPFGSGRRVCPGISFSLQVMQLTLASLLHAFDISTDGPVDMTEAIGMTNLKAHPLDVQIASRLQAHLYE